MTDTPQLRLAIVESVEVAGLLLRFEGEDAARTKVYRCLDSYIPAPGDRVCVVRVSGTYLVLGKISGQPVTARHANTADTANSATRADQIINQSNPISSYDIQLRASSATSFEIRRKNGSAWGAWRTITTT